MASSVIVLKLVCVVFVCMVVVSPHARAAMSCGTVDKNIAQCLTYLEGTGTDPSKACCTGVSTLKDMASTPAAKEAACECLKSAASSMSGLDSSRAAGLPDKCGVSISYSISPNTDCSKVN